MRIYVLSVFANFPNHFRKFYVPIKTAKDGACPVSTYCDVWLTINPQPSIIHHSQFPQLEHPLHVSLEPQVWQCSRKKGVYSSVSKMPGSGLISL